MTLQAKIILPALCLLLCVTYGAVWQSLKHKHKHPQANKTNAKVNEAEYTPLFEKGLFKVTIPEHFTSAPEVSIKQTEDLNTFQIIPYKSYSYTTASNAYRVGYIRYPEESWQNQDTQILLNNLRNAQLKDYQGKLKKEGTTFEPFEVVRRELEIHSTLMEDSLYIRTQLVVSRPYVFVLSYFSKGNADELYTDKANSFFRSFKIIFLEENAQAQKVMVGSDRTNSTNNQPL